MKKTYIQPKANAFVIEAESMLAASVQSFDINANQTGVEATNKKDMWGNEGLWN